MQKAEIIWSSIGLSRKIAKFTRGIRKLMWKFNRVAISENQYSQQGEKRIPLSFQFLNNTEKTTKKVSKIIVHVKKLAAFFCTQFSVLSENIGQ